MTQANESGSLIKVAQSAAGSVVGNDATVLQSGGSLNAVSVKQTITGSIKNQTNLMQGASLGSKMDVTQYGSANTLTAYQTGLEETLLASQNDIGNGLYASQAGDHNYAQTQQSGAANSATITQSGNRNIAVVTQKGVGNATSIAQR